MSSSRARPEPGPPTRERERHKPKATRERRTVFLGGRVGLFIGLVARSVGAAVSFSQMWGDAASLLSSHQPAYALACRGRRRAGGYVGVWVRPVRLCEYCEPLLLHGRMPKQARIFLRSFVEQSSNVVNILEDTYLDFQPIMP